MPIYGKSALSEEEKERLGRRLTFFLEEYIYHNKITSIEAAHRLGITPHKFSLLKNGGDQGRFITSMDYLKGLAKLDDLEMPEFMAFLEEKDLDKVKATNYSWDEKIYKALEGVSIPLRKQFAQEMESSKETNPRLAEMVCRFGRAASKVDPVSIEKMIEIIEHLGSKDLSSKVEGANA